MPNYKIKTWDDLKDDKEQKDIYRDNARFVARVNLENNNLLTYKNLCNQLNTI